MATISLNAAYIFLLFANSLRDMFWLRIALIGSQICFTLYGVAVDSQSMILWNIVFIGINATQIIQLWLQRRPIPLPDDLAEIHAISFADMSRREFLAFWEAGEARTTTDELILPQGAHVQELLYLVRGKAHVLSNESLITTLTRGRFIGEMSFLSKAPAVASVRAHGTAQYVAWPHATIESFQKTDAQKLIRLQSAIGRDLVHKLTTQSGLAA